MLSGLCKKKAQPNPVRTCSSAEGFCTEGQNIEINLHKGMFEAQEQANAEKSRQCDALKVERIRVEKAIAECNQDMERRVAMVVEWGATGDALLELEELTSHIAELSCSPDGKRGTGRTVGPDPLQDVEDCASEKVEILRAQVLEVKRSLEDVRSRSLAAATKPDRTDH
ncbi:unnamed protein product [Gadus morhua 'NCC']